VAAAYVVVFVLVLVYVAIMAVRLSRIQRELATLVRREQAAAAGARQASTTETPLP
jgi:CcmD family protein